MHSPIGVLAFVVLFSVVAAPARAADIPPYIAAAVADPARPAADVARDAERKPAETLAFAGIKPGDRVLELVPAGGYYTRILSRLVGPAGNIYAFTPSEILKVFPDAANSSRMIASDPQYSNVSVLVMPTTAMVLPRNLDAVWTTQNYHDLHLAKFFPNLDMHVFNKAMFAALRPGGLYFVSDHDAEPGSGLRDNKLHRIDSELVRDEVREAGFTFDGETDLLRDAGDPHTASVFDASIRGHTDQFTFRFRRPAR